MRKIIFLWVAQAWAVENGVSDGENPDRHITGEQLVSMLLRYNAPEALTTQTLLDQFPDAEDTSDWAVTAMEWAVANCIISGNGEGNLNPQGTATRAEIASILMRYMTME